MGIGLILAENERLRRELTERNAAVLERDAAIVLQNAAILERNTTIVVQNTAIKERDTAIEERDKALAERDAQIAALKISNEDLAQRLELIRIKASERRNQRFVEDEKVVPIPFLFGEVEPPPRLPKPEPEEKPEDRKPEDKKKPRPNRRDLSKPSKHPTRKVTCRVAPEAACKKCGGALKVFGGSHTYRMNWVPGHFEILDVERERCVCPNCPSEGVLVAPPPEFALPKALCANGLLARVLVDKFADRIPLNLQAERMRREGEDFSTATLSDWVLSAAAPGLLGRIAKAVGDRLMRGSWAQLDDTGYPVQDGLDGNLRKGRLWVVTDQQEAWYQFTDTKEGKNPATFLADFKGKLLLVDGGSEFNLVVEKKALLRAGCWSHLRTYFFDARHHFPAEAALALGTIRDLFSLEAGLVGAPLEVVKEVRERDSRPLVEGLFNWIVGIRRTTRPSSLLGEALTYAVNGRESFERFLSHPELPMHNNKSEFALRGPVVGRKSWLFAGCEGGAHAGAVMFTLLGSCKMQGIDPWVYLNDVLSKIQTHPVNRMEELTPLAWRLAHEG